MRVGKSQARGSQATCHHAKTVSCYRIFWEKSFIRTTSRSSYFISKRLSFQHDGLLAHFSSVVRNYLNASFERDGLLGRIYATPGGSRLSNILYYCTSAWNTWHFLSYTPISPLMLQAFLTFTQNIALANNAVNKHNFDVSFLCLCHNSLIAPI